MNHDGAYPGNTKTLFAPCWCIFVLSVYAAHVNVLTEKWILRSKSSDLFSLVEPRGSAHAASFSSSESVIVGNTLPSEVFVSEAPILKGGGALSQR